MILPRAAQAGEASEDTEFQLVQGAVLRECILNLARVKECDLAERRRRCSTPRASTAGRI